MATFVKQSTQCDGWRTALHCGHAHCRTVDVSQRSHATEPISPELIKPWWLRLSLPSEVIDLHLPASLGATHELKLTVELSVIETWVVNLNSFSCEWMGDRTTIETIHYL